MLSSIFLVGGVHALRNAPTLTAKAAPVLDTLVPLLQRAAPQLPIPTDPTLLIRANAAVQVASGLTLATGRAPRLSAAVLGATIVPTTFGGHRFWELDDPTTRNQQRLHFFKNLSLLGGLVIAAGDTDGKPGVAWRARRVAKDAHREARHFGRAARRETKLAKAQLT